MEKTVRNSSIMDDTTANKNGGNTMSLLWIRACLEEQGESEEAQEGPYEANRQALLGSQLQGCGAVQAQQNMELEATFPILPT